MQENKNGDIFFMCTKSLCLKKYRIWPWTSFFFNLRYLLYVILALMSWLCWVSHRNILPHTHTPFTALVIHCYWVGAVVPVILDMLYIYMYVDHDAKPPKEFFVEINNAYCIQGYFCPVVWVFFFALLHLHFFAPFWFHPYTDVR